MIRSSFVAEDGKNISFCEWADTENPKGIIQIAHGMAEHVLRYDMFAKKMNERGFIVVADDHRAHGETDRETHGYSDGNIWEETLSDMAILMKTSKKKYSNLYKKELGVVIFGHSYGSFLTQEFIKRHRDELLGAVIGGSSYFNQGLALAGRFISGTGIFFGRKAKPNNFLAKMSFDQYNKKFDEGTFISSIKEECERYEKDKNCGFVCSSNFYNCFFKGLRKLYKKGEGDNLKDFPILLVSGDSDPVGEMGKGVEKLEKWYKSKGADVNIKLYKGVRHEYLNDTSREEVTGDVTDFFNARFQK